VEDIRFAQEEKAELDQLLLKLLYDHSLLTKYSNVILIMYLSSI